MTTEEKLFIESCFNENFSKMYEFFEFIKGYTEGLEEDNKCYVLICKRNPKEIRMIQIQIGNQGLVAEKVNNYDIVVDELVLLNRDLIYKTFKDRKYFMREYYNICKILIKCFGFKKLGITK